MFTHFQRTPLTLNNQTLIVDSAQLSTEVQLSPKYVVDNYVVDNLLPESMWVGNLKVQYYLTGIDYLKQYIYSNEDFPITGNLAGLRFSQGYLSNYSISIEPNMPVMVNANISIFDKITGTFVESAQVNKTGLILRTSDVQVSGISSYTANPLSNITRASFDYNCNIKPTYYYYDSGVSPTRADDVFFMERAVSAELTSDNTNLDVPLSGEKFGVIFTFSNPSNTGLYETIGCSGFISAKSFSINTDQPHQHTIKISQPNVNRAAYITSATIAGTNLTINFNPGAFPLLSSDGNNNYIQKILIGDNNLTGYAVNRTSFDQIVAPIPYDITNDTLLVSTSYQNFVYPNKLSFTYPNITVTALSSNTGTAGNILTISGTNFTRISKVLFGNNTYSNFVTSGSQTISAIVPVNGQSAQIKVVSDLRGLSGLSNTFFYTPIITYMSMQTGQWKDTIILSGTSFSGITGIYFNRTPAYSFSVPTNNSIICQSPETGTPYCSGYINIYGTGGYARTISVYNPVVPIYGFSPITGFPGTQLSIYTKIDTGYLSPFSGGFKGRVGGNDIVFLMSGGNSTGALTGILAHDLADDYIYLYGPDGISTYPTSQKLSVIADPLIYYSTPTVVNQYQDFSMLIVGRGLKYFFNQPYFFALSGLVSGNMQTYGTSSFNSSADGQSFLINNISVTGSTGYYNVIMQNAVDDAVELSGLLVNPAINQMGTCFAVYDNPTVAIGLDNIYPASYSIDNSTGFPTFALMRMAQTGLTYSMSFYPSLAVGNPLYLNISKLIVNSQYTGQSEDISQSSRPVDNIPSGRIKMFQGTTVAYDTVANISFSGRVINFFPQTTGITKLTIFPATGVRIGGGGGNELFDRIYDFSAY